MSVSPINSSSNAAAAQMAAAGHSGALRQLPQSEQVKAAAGQFEAIILRQMLSDSVGKITGQGAAGSTYGFMLTDVLASKISEGGGLGLGSMLEKQLTPRTSLSDIAGTTEDAS